jgi:hypothetical protein
MQRSKFGFMWGTLIAAVSLMTVSQPAWSGTTGNTGNFWYTATADLDSPAASSVWHTMGGPGANVTYSTGSSRDIFLENKSSSSASYQYWWIQTLYNDQSAQILQTTGGSAGSPITWAAAGNGTLHVTPTNMSTARSTPAGLQHAGVDLEVHTSSDGILDEEEHEFTVLNP